MNERGSGSGVGLGGVLPTGEGGNGVRGGEVSEDLTRYETDSDDDLGWTPLGGESTPCCAVCGRQDKVVTIEMPALMMYQGSPNLVMLVENVCAQCGDWFMTEAKFLTFEDDNGVIH